MMFQEIARHSREGLTGSLDLDIKFTTRQNPLDHLIEEGNRLG